MAEDKDSAKREHGKQPSGGRVRLRRVPRQGREAVLPDLSHAEIRVATPEHGLDSIIIDDGNEVYQSRGVNSERFLAPLGLSNDKIQNLAVETGIRDLPLLRIVLAYAAQEARKTADCVISWHGVSTGISSSDTELMHRVNVLLDELEKSLRILLSPETGSVAFVARLASGPSSGKLLEALSEYGQTLSSLNVIEFTNPASRPPDDGRRSILVLLASSWQKLTRNSNTDYTRDFYYFVERVFHLVGRRPPSKPTIADWMNEVPSEKEQKKHPAND